MSEYQEAWNNEEPVSELGVTVPAWIDQDISPSEIAAIVLGGCASGAYMPAVTYYDAGQTMAKYGDDVVDYIAEDWPDVFSDGMSRYEIILRAVVRHIDKNQISVQSWSGLAVHVLSTAVELWANSVIDEIEKELECTA